MRIRDRGPLTDTIWKRNEHERRRRLAMPVPKQRHEAVVGWGLVIGMQQAMHRRVARRERPEQKQNNQQASQG